MKNIYCIETELFCFNQYLQGLLVKNFNEKNSILDHILKNIGKQIRPKLILLVANILGKINEKTYRAAALVEMLHTATLIHDDIIDEAKYRRKQPVVHIAFDTKIAVLLGDYLFAQCLTLAVQNKDYDLLTYISSVVTLMSQTEIQQLKNEQWQNITEAQYLTIIYNKTASLFAASLAMAAVAVQASEEDVNHMFEIGKNIGIAFQMQDDILDLEDNSVDKSTGIDIVNKKITLPFIFALSQSTLAEKKAIMDLIQSQYHQRNIQNDIITFIKKHQGIAYTKNTIKKYEKKSLFLLEKYPNSIYKENLLQIINSFKKN